MRNTFDRTIAELARTDDRVFFVVGDVSPITFKEFTKEFPERFWNVGIAESMMVSGAAGLALVGKVPYLCTIATFMTMRCYEQIRDDLGYQGLNVKLVGIGGGVSYATLGGTHHAIEDFAILRAIPGMTVVAPADPPEVARVARASLAHVGPMYIRLARNNEPALLPETATFAVGKAVPVRAGSDLTMISTGTILKQVLEAADMLERDGVSVRVLHMPTVKPLDSESLLRAAAETKAILSVEEHSVIGGLGSAVAEVLAENGSRTAFRRLGLQDRFCTEYGTHDDLLRAMGIDAAAITKTANALVGRIRL